MASISITKTVGTSSDNGALGSETVEVLYI